MEQEVTPVVQMPVKAKPYRHQIEAFNLAMRLFGITAENAGKALSDFNTAYKQQVNAETTKQKYHGGQK